MKKYMAYTRINNNEWSEAEVTDIEDRYIEAESEEEALTKYIESIADDLESVEAKKVSEDTYTYETGFDEETTLEIKMVEAE